MYKTIYLFGDSHARSFTVEKQLIVTPNLKIINCFKDSATIKGLTNSESKLKYGIKIIDILKNIEDKGAAIIVLKLGQVDVEYGFLFKRLVLGEKITLEDFCNELILKYKQFIESIKKIHDFRIIICSANIPNYKSEEYFHDYLIFIFQVLPNSKEKRVITDAIVNQIKDAKILEQIKNIHFFNQKLCKFCIDNHRTFLNTTKQFLDRKTGFIKKKFLGQDNHYKDVGGQSKDGLTQKIFIKKLLELCNK